MMNSLDTAPRENLSTWQCLQCRKSTGDDVEASDSMRLWVYRGMQESGGKPGPVELESDERGSPIFKTLTVVPWLRHRLGRSSREGAEFKITPQFARSVGLQFFERTVGRYVLGCD